VVEEGLDSCRGRQFVSWEVSKVSKDRSSLSWYEVERVVKSGIKPRGLKSQGGKSCRIPVQITKSVKKESGKCAKGHRKLWWNL